MTDETLRSNSLNYVPVRDVARPRGTPCPLASAPGVFEVALAGVAVERSLFLKLKDRMRLCSTESRDFSGEEIAQIKASGQLYADVSQKLAPDDFPTDLRKLERLRECERCSLLSRCPAAYAASARDVFGEDDARVRELVRALGGDVLDVGAGHAPYAAELESAALAGRARYVALDPDAERLALLASRWPWAETVVGDLGTLDPSKRRFRNVMFLRSVNHLPEPDAALGRAVALLAPGGHLLLVDDVPFGLVRTLEHAARAESGPSRFEHHRRDDAAAVHARCAALPLRLVERRDVRPEGSNLWLLHYEVTGAP